MSRRPGKPPQPVASPTLNDGLSWPTPWVCALIFGVTLLAYFPALQGGFIWDDSGHVTRPDLRSAEGLVRIWFELGATQQYYPLLHSAFWFEHLLWGDAPFGYHLINVLFHATSAVLFGVALRRLKITGAWLAALLFALHPVGVESVAWITEQKNTLSTVFYLGACLAYLRFDASRHRPSYVLAAVLFICALFTKSVTATLPAALLVIFWWQRGRIGWRRDVFPLLPFFVLSAIAGWVTAWVERKFIGAEGTDFALDAVDRCLLAGRVIWFYLGKIFWPADLIFIYPRWTVDATALWQWGFPLCFLALLAGLFWQSRRSRKYSRAATCGLAGMLFFAGTLFPALGFVNVFPFIYSFVADHFQYLAMLGILAPVAAVLTMALGRLPRWAGGAAGALLLAVLGTLTWRQCGMYRDLITLYETTISRNPACWMAHNNLATVLADSGRVPEAIVHVEQALRLRPNNAEAESNLGDDLTRVGRPLEAIPHLERALQLQPKFAAAHHNLAFALMAAGRLAEAVPHFERAVQLKPDDAQAQLDLGKGLTITNRFPEAVAHFQRAIQLKPDYSEAQQSFGRGLAEAGRLSEAIPHFEEALRIDPNYADAHLNLAQALRRLGRIDDANRHYAEGMRLRGVRTAP